MATKYVITILAALLLSGCATGYHEYGRFTGGGFSETQLGPNIWTVSFNGNGYTSSKRAVNLALLRAADLMLENGYPYFIVAESQSGSSTSTYRTPTRTYGSAHAVGNSAYGSATTYGGQTYTSTKPSTNMMVVGYTERPDTALVFDAQFISDSIRAKYGIE